MAFDFLSYMVDQTMQNSQLFVSVDKLQRKSIISHIISLQLKQLIDLDSKSSYQALQTSIQPLTEIGLSETRLTEFSNQLQQPAESIKTAYSKIFKNLLDELQQLNSNASLGETGVKELLDGQLPWIQQQVDEWFWIFINQTQHKVTKTHKNNSPDFNQIMKDFNQIILNKEQSNEHQSSATTARLDSNMAQKSIIIDFLNPIIALIILSFLHNIIL